MAKGKPVERMIKPGEKIRCDCDNCGAEFEVTYEPKAVHGVSGISPTPLCHCPFCGSESITTDADAADADE